MLYAYGCSYTYGSELADEDITGLSREKTDALKSKLGEPKFYDEYVEKPKKYNIYKSLMCERSYVNFIARNLGLATYVNRAVPGASNMHIFYQILEDINAGTFKDDDIIFVGITSLSRFSWHNESRSRLESCMAQGGIWPSKRFKKEYVLHTSNKDYVLQNIQAIYAIKHILKDYKFFYQTVHWPLTDNYGSGEIKNPLYNSLIDIDAGSVIPKHCLFYETPNPNEYHLYTHAFNHPYKEYHESFGNKLGEVIRGKI